MLGRLWPRFALEACFLVGVAVVAGLLHLATVAIVAVMLIAYLATQYPDLLPEGFESPEPRIASRLTGKVFG